MSYFKFITLVLALTIGVQAYAKSDKPNVILILTDDQGIGDLGCHGNPWLKTPNLDAFYKEAVRMTDFHVSPLCTPTRAAIMTGQYPINNGAWATFKGRDALQSNAVTMADVFKQAGYRTGIFGKWHLGDNYPARPTDLGFDVAVHHLAGGVGELSDYWGNDYFDDVYYVNNEPKKFEGYCTDVWFRETMKFIDANKEEPFFVYLPTNAPHDPLIVAEEYAAPYKHLEGDKIVSADLYGMIANIDENFGRFVKFLEDRKLSNNTILIYMSDNGTRFGYDERKQLGYNMGLRGIKGSKTEGGHKVPFFIRWPEAKIKGGKDIQETAAHVDLIPTLAGLCDIEIPKGMSLDGVDLSSLLLGQEKKIDNRTIFVHHRQDWRPPMEINETCLIQNQWRLINGNALYNVHIDPQQQTNLMTSEPGLAQQMKSSNEAFLAKTKHNDSYYELPVAIVGNSAQKEVKLTIQHAIGEDRGIWKTEQVAAGMKNKNNTHALQIDRAGVYRISCRRWPKECSGKVLGVPQKAPDGDFAYTAISPEKVSIQIANQMHEKDIQPNDIEVVFEVKLQRGKTLLVNDFIEGNEKYGVYYTYVSLIE